MAGFGGVCLGCEGFEVGFVRLGFCLDFFLFVCFVGLVGWCFVGFFPLSFRPLCWLE